MRVVSNAVPAANLNPSGGHPWGTISVMHTPLRESPVQMQLVESAG